MSPETAREFLELIREAQERCGPEVTPWLVGYLAATVGVKGNTVGDARSVLEMLAEREARLIAECEAVIAEVPK